MSAVGHAIGKARLAVSLLGARRLSTVRVGGRRACSTTPTAGWVVSDAGARAASPLATHEVSNQSTPLTGFNGFECDPSLTEAAAVGGAEWAVPHLSHLGALVGRADWQAVHALSHSRGMPVPPLLPSLPRHCSTCDLSRVACRAIAAC